MYAIPIRYKETGDDGAKVVDDPFTTYVTWRKTDGVDPQAWPITSLAMEHNLSGEERLMMREKAENLILAQLPPDVLEAVLAVIEGEK